MKSRVMPSVHRIMMQTENFSVSPLAAAPDSVGKFTRVIALCLLTSLCWRYSPVSRH